MKPKGKGKGGGGAPSQEPLKGTMAKYDAWNDFAMENAPGAIDYAQNNPYQGMAQDYIGSMLGGSMGTNPWMQNLYGNISGINLSEGMGMLEDFLGYGQGSGGKGGKGGGSKKPTTGGGGAWRPAGQGGGYSGGGGGGGSYHSSSSSGGNIPDSTVGEGVFSREINEVLDDARLDPANDPTMQPMIDAIQRESEESYYSSLQELHAGLEGAGMFGSGMYQAMMNNRNEDYNEALQQTLAQQYQAARQAAQEHKMTALNMVNQRDIASAQIAAQESAAAGAAAAQADAIAAQMEMHNKTLQLQGIGMALDAGKFGLGLQGDMASLMQQGQLGALQMGQGYGQLGMMGYDAAQGMAGIGLGALGAIGGMQQNLYNAQQQANQFNQQLAWQQQQYADQAPLNYLNSLINVMSGLNSMGGYDQSMPYMPSSVGAAPQGFGGSDILAGLLGGAGTYMKAGGQF